MLDDRQYMREEGERPGMTVTVALVLANAVVFALMLIAGLPFARPLGSLFEYLVLSPQDLAHGYVWQLFTFQFLHAGILHLVVNLAMLYLFGRSVEAVLGRRAFLALYLACGTVGGLFQAACAWVFPGHFGLGGVVGASAGVFGVVAAFAALNWETPITTLVAFILPVTMRAKYLVLVTGILAVFGMLSGGGGVAHAAHLGGLLAGLGFVQGRRRWPRAVAYWNRWRPQPRRRELVGASVARTRSARSQRRSATAIPEDLPPAEFISREVDPILDKISAHGIQSLTERERRILEAARSRIGRK